MCKTTKISTRDRFIWVPQNEFNRFSCDEVSYKCVRSTIVYNYRTWQQSMNTRTFWISGCCSTADGNRGTRRWWNCRKCPTAPTEATWCQCPAWTRLWTRRWGRSARHRLRLRRKITNRLGPRAVRWALSPRIPICWSDLGGQERKSKISKDIEIKIILCV